MKNKLLLLLMLLAPLGARAATRSITTSSTTCQTGASCLIVPVSNNNRAAVALSGTFTGTLQFEASANGGTTWVAITGIPVPTAAGVTSATATGVWQFNVAALTHIRVRASALAVAPVAVVINVARSIEADAGGTLTTNRIPKVGAGGSLTDSRIADDGSAVVIHGSDIATNLIIAGVTKAVRIGAGATASQIEGVDNSGSGSYQPLFIGGSTLTFTTSGTPRVAIPAATDGFTFGAAADTTLYRSGTNILKTDGRFQLGTVHFASRGAVVPGQTFYCDDCDPSTVSGVANECTSVGTKTGAIAFGTGTKWGCKSVQ